MTRTATTPRLTAGLCAAALLAAFTLSACDSADGPAEKAGESIDNAAQTAGDKVEAAGDKIKDATN